MLDTHTLYNVHVQTYGQISNFFLKLPFKDLNRVVLTLYLLFFSFVLFCQLLEESLNTLEYLALVPWFEVIKVRTVSLKVLEELNSIDFF